jgi:hypothetical protein
MIEFTSANQIRLNSGVCIDADATDTELGIRALVGYHHYFMVGAFDAQQMVTEACIKAGINYRGFVQTKGDSPPMDSVRVGQVRVHHGDRAMPLFAVKLSTKFDDAD